MAPAFRRQGFTRLLLAELDKWALENSVDFAFLFGDHRVYGGWGFRPVTNPLRYWKYEVEEWREEAIGSAQARPYGNMTWPAEGLIDLRGPMF